MWYGCDETYLASRVEPGSSKLTLFSADLGAARSNATRPAFHTRHGHQHGGGSNSTVSVASHQTQDKTEHIQDCAGGTGGQNKTYRSEQEYKEGFVLI